MAWIRTIDPEHAQGKLGEIYFAGKKRAGKVFQILRVQSLHPEILHASLRLHAATTTALDSPLPRWFRELIAVTVSRLNHCVY